MMITTPQLKIQKLQKSLILRLIQKHRHGHHGNIFRRRRGVSRFTYIFSISFRGRLEPSGKLTNFQPPPPPRFPRGPIFSTVKFHPSEGRRRLYLWHFTSPANCTQAKPYHMKGSRYTQYHITPIYIYIYVYMYKPLGTNQAPQIKTPNKFCFLNPHLIHLNVCDD